MGSTNVFDFFVMVGSSNESTEMNCNIHINIKPSKIAALSTFLFSAFAVTSRSSFSARKTHTRSQLLLPKQSCKKRFRIRETSNYSMIS
jgi:hypothetical protein